MSNLRQLSIISPHTHILYLTAAYLAYLHQLSIITTHSYTIITTHSYIIFHMQPTCLVSTNCQSSPNTHILYFTCSLLGLSPSAVNHHHTLIYYISHAAAYLAYLHQLSIITTHSYIIFHMQPTWLVSTSCQSSPHTHILYLTAAYLASLHQLSIITTHSYITFHMQRTWLISINCQSSPHTHILYFTCSLLGLSPSAVNHHHTLIYYISLQPTWLVSISCQSSPHTHILYLTAAYLAYLHQLSIITTHSYIISHCSLLVKSPPAVNHHHTLIYYISLQPTWLISISCQSSPHTHILYLTAAYLSSLRQLSIITTHSYIISHCSLLGLSPSTVNHHHTLIYYISLQPTWLISINCQSSPHTHISYLTAAYLAYLHQLSIITTHSYIIFHMQRTWLISITVNHHHTLIYYISLHPTWLLYISCTQRVCGGCGILGLRQVNAPLQNT